MSLKFYNYRFCNYKSHYYNITKKNIEYNKSINENKNIYNIKIEIY